MANLVTMTLLVAGLPLVLVTSAAVVVASMLVDARRNGLCRAGDLRDDRVPSAAERPGVGGQDAERAITLEHDRGDVRQLRVAFAADHLPQLLGGDPGRAHRPNKKPLVVQQGREALTSRWKRSLRVPPQAIAYCMSSSTANAATPSASATVFDSNVVARVEPNATVTTRSKAFSLASERFPLTRNISTNARYAATPTIATRPSPDQPWNKM